MFGNKLKIFGWKENDDIEGNDKKKIESLVFFVVLLIITVVIINVIWNGNKQKTTKEEINDKSKKLASDTTLNTNLERKRTEIA